MLIFQDGPVFIWRRVGLSLNDSITTYKDVLSHMVTIERHLACLYYYLNYLWNIDIAKIWTGERPGKFLQDLDYTIELTHSLPD